MYNGCTDLNEISKAVTSGLIEQRDFDEYQRITNSIEILRKGLEQEALTGIQYVTAISHTDKCSFVKSNDGGMFKYKLNVIKGEQLSDEFKKSMEPTALSKSGQRISRYVRDKSTDTAPPAVIRAVNEITELAERVKRNR